MNNGTRVRIVNPDSLFYGKGGTIQETRRPPLPLGIVFDRGRMIVWFAEKELEEAGGTEKVQVRGVLSISN